MTNKISTIKLSPTLRIGEAAKLLGVTTTTLRRWDKVGYLKPIRMGNRSDRRYKKEDVLKLLNEGLK